MIGQDGAGGAGRASGAGGGARGPFRPGGPGRQPWVAGNDAPGANAHPVPPESASNIDFSKGGVRAETDGSEAPRGDDAARADPAGSGARPEGASRASGTPVLVEFYAKPGCHLCDEARPVVEQVVAQEGAEFVEHDITADPALMTKYGEYIPVVVVEGRQHTTWRVDRGMLSRAIAAARRSRGRWCFGRRKH